MAHGSVALGRAELLDSALVLRAFYLAASALILIIQAIPALRSRFVAYGSRAPSTADPASATSTTTWEQLLDYAATFQVPHNFFTHFYVVSVASSMFWGWKLRLWSADAQLRIVWALMLLQGGRRVLESYMYTSSSKSRMWFGHWILGLLFYLATNVAVWIELRPSGTIPTTSAAQEELGLEAAVLVPGILSAQILQHTYHAYLYALRSRNAGYQLPSHPLFPNLLCPHYTCEVTIYALLSILAAPAGSRVNWTLVCATILVAVNLGVTAIGTKDWYAEKFGKEKVSDRKRMVPWVW